MTEREEIDYLHNACMDLYLMNPIEEIALMMKRLDSTINLLLSPGTTISGGDSIQFPMSERK